MAYFYPQIAGGVFRSYEDHFHEPPSEAVVRFLKHNLMRNVWLLLDKEFMYAYEHGIPIMCGDGVLRRVSPRMLMYSANYPEKCVNVAW